MHKSFYAFFWKDYMTTWMKSNPSQSTHSVNLEAPSGILPLALLQINMIKLKMSKYVSGAMSCYCSLLFKVKSCLLNKWIPKLPVMVWFC